jgi:DNA-binding response OmpR family regulator
MSKILIIDDDPDINNLFKLSLEYDGYKVYAYMNPLDALYAFRKYF